MAQASCLLEPVHMLVQSAKQMTYYPYRATEVVVEALVPKACGKSIGGWHNRLYNISRKLLGGRHWNLRRAHAVSGFSHSTESISRMFPA